MSTALSTTYIEHIRRTEVRYATQETTVDQLNALTTIDFVVDAEPVVTVAHQGPVLAYDTCQDCDQRGTCLFVDGTLLCPAGAIAHAQRLEGDDVRIEIGVLL